MEVSELTEPYRRYLAAVTTYHHAVASAIGLGASDYQALNLLELAPEGMNIGELANSTGLTHSAATRMVDRLEAGGYVERAADPADRRRSVIRVGQTMPPGLLEAVSAVRTHLAPAFTDLDDQGVAVLARYLQRSTDGFMAATDEIMSGQATRRSDH